MQIEKRVFLLTGSNIEPRADYLAQAEKEIETIIGKILSSSSIYESEPWGFAADTAFFNKVLIVITSLSPIEILNRIHSIENAFGRIRKKNVYVSRTLDIDILYIESEIINSEELTVPHPRLHERKFTLAPLAEIAGSFMHPVLHKTNEELLRNVSDQSKLSKTEVVKDKRNV